MFVSIEVSLYPLKKEFIQLIDDFINSLEKYDKIEIRTNVMSTQLFGEFDDLMKISNKILSFSFIFATMTFSTITSIFGKMIYLQEK